MTIASTNGGQPPVDPKSNLEVIEILERNQER